METRRSVLGRLVGPLCCGLLLFVLMLLDGSASSETYAVDIEVKDESNKTCLYARWMMNFSVIYESNASEYKNKAFTLPENVTYDGSTCGDKTSGPLLAIEFGAGHFWSIKFAKTDDTYQGNITFIYNTNDAELFPDAKRKGPVVTSANYPVHPIKLHTVYTCHHVDSVKVGNVTNDLWNISLQAFLLNGSLSTEYTHCDKGVVASAENNPPAITTVSTTTTTLPTTATITTTTTIPTTTTTIPTTTTTIPTTTTTTTTTIPTTTTTTTMPTTTTTTTMPTTTASTTTTTSTTTVSTTTTTTATTVKTTMLSPAPLPTAQAGEKPVTGNYSVNVGATACLLASMGLQLNISKDQSSWIINIQPNTTEVTGSCGRTSADLRLNDSDNIIIDFFFAVRNTSLGRFYLKGVNITVVRPANGSLYAVNNSLSYWDASLGSSYMCRKEETLIVTEGFRIKTFDLRVQPFDVKENKYSTAQECSLDDDTILIPIAVGTALVILIVIIVFAYVIGRRKGYAGYQTLQVGWKWVKFVQAEDCSPEVDNFFVPIVVAAALAGLVCLIFMAYFVGRRKHRGSGYEQF
ncbi:PREDICTED: lysosome-associated membrane glycoprotein 2 [Gekko japonicus]|uniref:Lysosome-associated membrane glycoprotein 2 n=1 Tax=Gekko japonicus TaxID=146911 RepID=A0ABM1L991_GEKJA|nr:PREDICTED: lysosome-associated membrane glycoprotein 2 [Gekko japonicus]